MFGQLVAGGDQRGGGRRRRCHQLFDWWGCTQPLDGVRCIGYAAARAAGVVVVVSAGNDGPSEGSLTSPANAPWVLAVANATHNRTLGSRLLDFVGGTSSAPGGGSLLGAGSTTGYGLGQHRVIPQDFPTCGMGDGLDWVRMVNLMDLPIRGRGSLLASMAKLSSVCVVLKRALPRAITCAALAQAGWC